MGTLTKKLHVLKSGGTEETCNIYTTPEEVGGSPYLALEVDGQKGYVKLGSTTDANATHLRVKKNGTTYAAWKSAEVAVPTGSAEYKGEGSTITVPPGVTIFKVTVDYYGNIGYVGVTPGKTYQNVKGIEYFWDQEEDRPREEVYVRRDNTTWAYAGFEGADSYGSSYVDFTLSWSPEINEMTPTYTDY